MTTTKASELQTGQVRLRRNEICSDSVTEMFFSLFRLMATAREADRREKELIASGEAFFQVSGAGHEGSAVLARHLGEQDWLNLHYRDKALMIARGMPLAQLFHSLLCNSASHSQGRQMSAHFSDPRRKIVGMVGPVGNSALQAVGIAHELRHRAQTEASRHSEISAVDDAIVICSFGDGTSQQGEVLEAIAEAVRERLRVLFWIEDNGLSISTKTGGRTFFDTPCGPVKEFYGVPIQRIDGWNLPEADRKLQQIIPNLRLNGGPGIVVFRVERLDNHTNADDERAYRDSGEMAQARHSRDPLKCLRNQLLEAGIEQERIEELESEIKKEVYSASDEALAAAIPKANFDARPPLLKSFSAVAETSPLSINREGDKQSTFTMLEAIKEVLRKHLEEDPRVTLYGQDIEDPKGDVFGLTRGLSRAFPAQVNNSPLSESTILGVSIGRALAGGRPVACIQFADFLPLAFNQIASELGSIYWRTAGGWQCPVVVMAPCGAYRPGLGPFHAQTFESILAHVPGIDVYMPSNASDAAGLLNTALQGGRPTVFLYPKTCLNDEALATDRDGLKHLVTPGTARFISRGRNLTLVSWGSTVLLCQKAVELLDEAGVECDLIDLRTIAPWDRAAVCDSVCQTRRLIVVHEDNHTCGFGAEVLATVSEACGSEIEMRRITRPDTYLPCNYSNQLEVLPSLRRILEAAASLCRLSIKWEAESMVASDIFVVRSSGSSPADQHVTILEWKVQEGDRIDSGCLLAECEAEKASFELLAPRSGIIRNLQKCGEAVKVGEPLAEIVQDKSSGKEIQRHVSIPTKPILGRNSAVEVQVERGNRTRIPSAGNRLPFISSIQYSLPPAIITNEDLVHRFTGRSADDIWTRTGIETRRHLAAGDSILSLATEAAQSALKNAALRLENLDAIIVSTSTPSSICPSMACLLHHKLLQAAGGGKKDLAAWDISAACTGYLYALKAAFDWCLSQPAANVLVVTAEAMSRSVNPNDFDTAILFGDAASATLVHGPDSPYRGTTGIRLHRPLIGAEGEDGSILSLGPVGDQSLRINGGKVFSTAVRYMIDSLHRACDEEGIRVEDLRVVIPHQANGRILEAMARRLVLPRGMLLNSIRNTGNTSSSSIPLALADFINQTAPSAGKVGLCAFGGGLTFGAAILGFET